MSFMFVLAFVGCDKAEANTDEKQTTTGVVEGVVETVDGAKEANKEHKGCEGKGACDKTKEAVKELTDN